MDIKEFTEKEMVIFSIPELVIKELKLSGVRGLLILDNSGVCCLQLADNRKEVLDLYSSELNYMF